MINLHVLPQREIPERYNELIDCRATITWITSSMWCLVVSKCPRRTGEEQFCSNAPSPTCRRTNPGSNETVDLRRHPELTLYEGQIHCQIAHQKEIHFLKSGSDALVCTQLRQTESVCCFIQWLGLRCSCLLYSFSLSLTTWGVCRAKDIRQVNQEGWSTCSSTRMLTSSSLCMTVAFWKFDSHNLASGFPLVEIVFWCFQHISIFIIVEKKIIWTQIPKITYTRKYFK